MRIRIDDLYDLIAARHYRRSVVCPSFTGFRKPKPAAFVMNLSCDIVARMIDSGLYVHLPKNCEFSLYEKKP